jgi:hypothetical protein
MIASAIGMPVTDTSSLTTLEVSRALVAAHRKLPQWSRMTHDKNFLSERAQALNAILSRENDPNRLIENELPKYFSNGDSAINTENASYIATQVVEAFKEIQNAYPALLSKLKDKFDHRIGLSPNRKNLKTRAKAIQDFGFSFRDDAFINHIIKEYGKDTFYSTIFGFVANKPVDKWNDKDSQNAVKNLLYLIESFEMAEKLIRISLAEPKVAALLQKEPTGQHLLFVGKNKQYQLQSLEEDFVVTDQNRTALIELRDKINGLLSVNTIWIT